MRDRVDGYQSLISHAQRGRMDARHILTGQYSASSNITAFTHVLALAKLNQSSSLSRMRVTINIRVREGLGRRQRVDVDSYDRGGRRRQLREGLMKGLGLLD